MDILWEELIFGLTDTRQLIQVCVRLAAAVLLGAIIGYEREKAGKPAGFRTHILVMLGTSMFVLAGIKYGMSSDGLSRIIQGIVTGIGFIGAGAILKIDDQRKIKGLTSSAGIWMTAAIGVLIGLGAVGIAVIATLLTLVILTMAHNLEIKFDKKVKNAPEETE